MPTTKADVDDGGQLESPETLIRDAVADRFELKHGESISPEDDRLDAFINDVVIADITDTVYDCTIERWMNKHVTHTTIEESTPDYESRTHHEVPVRDPEEYVNSVYYYSTDHEVQTCSSCSGEEVLCNQCDGRGNTDCQNCMQGTVLETKICPDCGGDGEVEDGRCYKCNKHGEETITESCDTCTLGKVVKEVGTKRIEVTCDDCNGDGEITRNVPCSRCNGMNTSYTSCPTCSDGQIEEQVPCQACQGSTTVNCPTCNGGGNWCDACHNTGETHKHLLITAKYAARAGVDFEPDDPPMYLSNKYNTDIESFNEGSHNIDIPQDDEAVERIKRQRAVNTHQVREVTYEYDESTYTVYQIDGSIYNDAVPDISPAESDNQASNNGFLFRFRPSIRDILTGIVGVGAYMLFLAVALDMSSLAIQGVAGIATLGIAWALSASPRAAIPGVLFWAGAPILLVGTITLEVAVMGVAIAAPLGLVVIRQSLN